MTSNAVRAKLRPSGMLIGPVARLTSSALPTNQTAARCQARPVRSRLRKYSIETKICNEIGAFRPIAHGGYTQP